MQHTSLQILNNVALGVEYLVGTMEPTEGKTVSLDDKDSFVVKIDRAETHLTSKDLSALLNEYLLPQAESSVKNLAITFRGKNVLMKGDLHKGIDLPFACEARLSVTPSGNIRFHTTDIQVAGVMKKGLLDFFGLKLATMAQPKKQTALHIEGDDIFVSVSRLFPPPRVVGKLSGLTIVGNELDFIFGAANPPLAATPGQSRNYIYFLGGTMCFGKLTMKDVDLELVDKDPTTPFGFSLDHYYEQLEAGSSQTLPNRGLRVTLPDYSTLHLR